MTDDWQTTKWRKCNTLSDLEADYRFALPSNTPEKEDVDKILANYIFYAAWDYRLMGNGQSGDIDIYIFIPDLNKLIHLNNNT